MSSRRDRAAWAAAGVFQRPAGANRARPAAVRPAGVFGHEGCSQLRQVVSLPVGPAADEPVGAETLRVKEAHAARR